MTNPRRLLLAALVLLVVLAVGLAAFARITQAAVGCPPPQNTGAPPPQPVTAADFFAQGNYDYDQGKCDSAIADYSHAIALDPRMAAAYNNRAYTDMITQDYASALPDLDHAIALRPDYVNALMNRGDIYNYYYNIDYDKAVADYDRVLALDHQHTSVCGHRLLAKHHGWDLGVVVTVYFRGTIEAGCE